MFILPPDTLPTVGPPILPIFRLGPPIPLRPGPPAWFSPDPRRLGGGGIPPPPRAHLWRGILFPVSMTGYLINTGTTLDCI